MSGYYAEGYFRFVQVLEHADQGVYLGLLPGYTLSDPTKAPKDDQFILMQSHDQYKMVFALAATALSGGCKAKIDYSDLNPSGYGIVTVVTMLSD